MLNVIEGNKLIAKFDGGVFMGKGKYPDDHFEFEQSARQF
jgi:hypothetical protein